MEMGEFGKVAEEAEADQPISNGGVVDQADLVDNVIEELVSLIYVGRLFEYRRVIKSALEIYSIRVQRDILVNKDDEIEERDFDFISMMASRVAPNPKCNASLDDTSHEKALERCIEHAKLWLKNSNEKLVNNATDFELKEYFRLQSSYENLVKKTSDVELQKHIGFGLQYTLENLVNKEIIEMVNKATYAELKKKLVRIRKSEFFKAEPAKRETKAEKGVDFKSIMLFLAMVATGVSLFLLLYKIFPVTQTTPRKGR